MKYKKFFNVAGVTFENRQDIIADLTDGETFYLKAEPENQYDANALAVWVHYPPEARLPDAKVGYVPKDRASEYHAMMRVSDFTITLEERVGGFNIDFDRQASYGLVMCCEASYDANNP